MEENRINKLEIDHLFEVLSKEKISYCIIRGYFSDDDLYNGSDIDIYLDKKDKRRFQKLVYNFGYKTPRINDNSFPHKQYFKLVPGKLLKLDVVTSFRFGKKLFKLAQPINVKENIVELQGKQVLKPEFAFKIFLLHLIIDKKGLISTQNSSRLNEFISSINEPLSNELKMLLEIVESKKPCNIATKQLIKNKIIVKSKCALLHNLRQRINYYRFRLSKKTRNKKICFLGVDGSGKSSTLDYIFKMFDGRLVSKYMGFHSMETKWGELYLSKNKISPKFKRFLYIRKEMIYRLRNIKNNQYRPVLLDRYPWEATLNNKGKYKLIYWLLFNVFFPRPKMCFYFHCDVETSLRRKTDILDICAFQNNKAKADKKYLNKKRIVNIDTSKTSYEEIASLFCSVMMKKKFYELMI